MDGANRLLGDAVRLPTVPGRRVELRWITTDDIPALFAIFGDAEVCRYWSRPPLADADGAVALVEEIHAQFAERSLFQWAVVAAESGALVGTCTLASIDTLHGRAEVGYAVRRDSWGRGHATDAVTTLVRYAFAQLDLRRLEADVDPRNDASIRLLERIGFRREGLQRERYLHGGELQDAVLFGLLRREWREGHG